MYQLPRKFKDASLRGLKSTNKWQRAVLDYAEDMPRQKRRGIGLLLSGPPGVGKSWATAAITNNYLLIDPRPDFEWLTAPDLFDKADDFEVKLDAWRGQTWATTLEEVPWLVINDLGKEYRAGGLHEQVVMRLGRLLRMRCEHERVTHITTNFSAPQIQEVYGESIASLLKEMTTFIAAIGEDRRGSRPRTSG